MGFEHEETPKQMFLTENKQTEFVTLGSVLMQHLLQLSGSRGAELVGSACGQTRLLLAFLARHRAQFQGRAPPRPPLSFLITSACSSLLPVTQYSCLLPNSCHVVSLEVCFLYPYLVHRAVGKLN